MKQENVWDKIGLPWKKFRNQLNREITEFLNKKYGRVLDLGCGSGRNFVKVDKLKFYGVDFSEKMLKLAREYANEEKIDVELIKSGVDEIPFADEFFDCAIYSAVLHCVDSSTKRKKSIEELLRVLKSGAEVFISVWSRNQKRIKNKDKECFIPWTVGNEKYLRYTYIYDKDELEKLLVGVGFEIVKTWENENINIIAKKPISS